MVAEHNHNIVDIGIHIIHSKHIVHACEAVAPTLSIGFERLADSLLEREVHDRRHVAIEAVVVVGATLPVSYGRGRACPTFAYDIEVRIFVHDGFNPLASRNHLDIWVGVNAQTIEVGILNPPDSPLLEIFEQIRVLEVHIRHWAVEPSAVG